MEEREQREEREVEEKRVEKESWRRENDFVCVYSAIYNGYMSEQQAGYVDVSMV